MNYEITHQTLRKVVDKLAEPITDVIMKISKDIKKVQLVRENSFKHTVIPQRKHHPLALQWLDLLQDIEFTENQKALILSGSAIALLDDLVAINMCVDDENFDRQINRLTDANEYESVINEFQCFAFCKSRGSNPKFVRPSENGEKSYDIQLLDGRVSVECKRLRTRTDIRREKINRLIGSISNCLEKKNITADIVIEEHEEIDDNEVPQITKFFLKNIANLNLITKIKLRKLSIFIRRVPAINTKKELKRNHNEKNNEFIYIEHQKISPSKQPWGCKISVRRLIDNDLSKSIIRQIRRAKNQVDKSKYSIVYISLSSRNLSSFYKITDKLHEYIHHYFKKSGSSVNAIILAGQFYDQNYIGGAWPIRQEYRIIPNFICSKPLPDNFCLPGSTAKLVPLYRDFELQTESTFIQTMYFDHTHEVRDGLFLIRYISCNGFRQLSVRLTNYYIIRVELLHEKIGVIIGEGFVDSIKGKTLVKIGVAWTPSGRIHVAIDKKIIPLSIKVY